MFQEHCRTTKNCAGILTYLRRMRRSVRLDIAPCGGCGNYMPAYEIGDHQTSCRKKRPAAKAIAKSPGKESFVSAAARMTIQSKVEAPHTVPIPRETPRPPLPLASSRKGKKGKVAPTKTPPAAKRQILSPKPEQPETSLESPNSEFSFDFEILPPGEWSRSEILGYYDKVYEYHQDIYEPQRIIELLKIRPYPPQRIGKGLEGWTGYCVFQIPGCSRVILEKPQTNNATYILWGDWKLLIGKSKNDLILNHAANVKRIYHTGKNWVGRVETAAKDLKLRKPKPWDPDFIWPT